MAKESEPEALFRSIVSDSQEVFGEALLSIVLYGSGAGRDYLPGKSDLNLLFLLSQAGMDRLEGILAPAARWRRHRVATPLLMTPADFSESQDAYPVEFINMQRQYRILTGEDPLKGLAFNPAHVRLQLERELRGKLLHLRGGYLETEHKGDRIRELIRASLSAFVSLFSALLYLKREPIPEEREGIIAAGCAAAGLDAAVFLTCEQVRRQTDGLSSAQVHALLRDYLRQVEHLCGVVQALPL